MKQCWIQVDVNADVGFAMQRQRTESMMQDPSKRTSLPNDKDTDLWRE